MRPWRAVARACYGVTVWLAQDVVQSVREQPSLVASLSVYGALREVCCKRGQKPPARESYLAQLRSREVGRGGGGRLKRDGCVTVCEGSHDTQRVHVPCVFECVI